MAKVTVVTLASQREDALRALQALGVLHVHHDPRAGGTSSAEAANAVRNAELALRLLDQYAGEQPLNPATQTQPALSTDDPHAIISDILALHDRLNHLAEQRVQLRRQYDALAVWGDFDPAQITALTQRGVYIKLYQCEPEQIPPLPADCVMGEIQRTRHSVAFIVVANHDFTLPIPETPLPAESRSAIAQRLAALDTEQRTLSARVAAYAPLRPLLLRALAHFTDDFARARARDSMGAVSTLSYLTGFCPVDALPRIQTAAHAHGWGLIITDPEPDDPVPTLIRNPRWLRPIEAVFEFIDTFPGYRERDISGVFFIFFALFYAMLIGDACYGLIFLALTALIHFRWKARVPQQPLYLMYVLNTCTVIYGVLTGSYFGITLPDHALMRRWVVLDNTDFRSMVFFCFVIAAVQIIIARIWNVLRFINSIRALGEAGWALVVVAAYFLANKLILGRPIPAWAPALGASGLLLALIATIASTRGEELIGELFQFPFKAINCFGDIASYMRLFAVGFAGAAMAQAFNAIAAQIGLRGPVTSAVVVLILAVGHALNLILSLLSVMVHGLRLNMLEFSGHLGQEWSGIKYQPLAHTLRDS
ncbi:MAG: hypothetical protein N2595_03675 [bacterium]|nr:hypothetical protein [bacterium]